MTSGAADHPKFLSLKQSSVIGYQFSVGEKTEDAVNFFSVLITED